jgi:hypothetical protein
MMKIDEAREIVAQAWCDDRTSNTVMDPTLAQVFAEILIREISKAEEETAKIVHNTYY